MQQQSSQTLSATSKTSTSKDKIKFLLLESIDPSAIDMIKAAGSSQIESPPGALSGEDLKQKIAGAHLLGIRSRTQLTADELARLDDSRGQTDVVSLHVPETEATR